MVRSAFGASTIAALAIAALAVTAGCSSAPNVTQSSPSSAARPPPSPPAQVRVEVFRGASNIPIYMAMERGAFARHGITPELTFTPSSDALRTGLAAGRIDIAHGGVDNAVAMIEVAKADALIVGGGEAGMNELLVRPEIGTVADLRGRTLVVDAPNTAYALVGRKILKNAGLADGVDYKLDPLGSTERRTRSLETPAGAAVLLNPPWSVIAKDNGAKSLGRVIDLYGRYQATGAWVMRGWAQSHGDVLTHYLAAYIEGCRAAQNPANREQTIGVLERELKVSRKVAESTYAELMTPGHGLAHDCAFDWEGFRNVLALRAEMEGQWGGKPPAPERYVDLSWWDRAVRLAGR